MAALARQLVMLSKPRIVAMLVFTAVCGVWKAAEGAPVTTCTTVLPVFSSCAFNSFANACASSPLRTTITTRASFFWPVIFPATSRAALLPTG